MDGEDQSTMTADPWPIIRSIGFETLRLGDRRNDIQARFGEFDTFRRGGEARDTDQFFTSSGGGLMVTYDATGRAEFIEMAEPFNPTIEGVLLMGRQADEVARDLRSKNVEVSESRSTAGVFGSGCLWKRLRASASERVDGL
jgi:hypothetical protein